MSTYEEVGGALSVMGASVAESESWADPPDDDPFDPATSTSRARSRVRVGCRQCHRGGCRWHSRPLHEDDVAGDGAE